MELKVRSWENPRIGSSDETARKAEDKGKPRENAKKTKNKNQNQKTPREYFKEEVINPTEYS